MPRKIQHASEVYPRNDDGGPAWRNRGPCGYPACTAQGLIAIETTTGWLNLCQQHIEPWYHKNFDKLKLRRSDNMLMRDIRAGMHKNP